MSTIGENLIAWGALGATTSDDLLADALEAASYSARYGALAEVEWVPTERARLWALSNEWGERLIQKEAALREALSPLTARSGCRQ